jgi:hypothetical protein
MKKACNVLCGKGRVRTQDLGYQAERTKDLGYQAQSRIPASVEFINKASVYQAESYETLRYTPSHEGLQIYHVGRMKRSFHFGKMKFLAKC